FTCFVYGVLHNACFNEVFIPQKYKKYCSAPSKQALGVLRNEHRMVANVNLGGLQNYILGMV
ncbi:MAG: hypothetical protein ACI308_01170, partial [Muribaculaceae bacterium]